MARLGKAGVYLGSKKRAAVSNYTFASIHSLRLRACRPRGVTQDE